MTIQVGLGNEKDKGKWKKCSITKFRDGNEHIMMDNEVLRHRYYKPVAKGWMTKIASLHRVHL